MSKIQDDDRLYMFLRPYVDWIFRCSYRSFRYIGKENIPTNGAVIFSPNHANALCDAMAVLGIDHSPKVFVARADIFRNPKYAASFFQSQSDVPTLEVASLLQPGDYDEALLPKFYAFTNADSVKLYRGDAYIGEFFPNKKEYPALAHPPIVIDDIIGALDDALKLI